MAGIYLLAREEGIVVGDFFTPVRDLLLWIPAHSPRSAMPFDELYTSLLRKYMRPKREILEAAGAFYDQHFGATRYISVHARGSDKHLEQPGLDDLNAGYYSLIDEFRRRTDAPKISLMTDDMKLLDDYVKRYGRDVIFTDCQRSATSQGVHLMRTHDPERLGVEVMADAYIAIRGAAFIGNAASNPSQLVRYLGTWGGENFRLLGYNVHRNSNGFLHLR